MRYLSKDKGLQKDFFEQLRVYLAGLKSEKE